ncbi:hypothetical protein MRB53_042119 [Persea americana]|nr:hypothetical protein MRB53_042119 [Persea americana]
MLSEGSSDPRDRQMIRSDRCNGGIEGGFLVLTRDCCWFVAVFVLSLVAQSWLLHVYARLVRQAIRYVYTTNGNGRIMAERPSE